MENEFEDLKVYINEKVINQDAKLEENALRCWKKLKQK